MKASEELRTCHDCHRAVPEHVGAYVNRGAVHMLWDVGPQSTVFVCDKCMRRLERKPYILLGILLSWLILLGIIALIYNWC